MLTKGRVQTVLRVALCVAQCWAALLLTIAVLSTSERLGIFAELNSIVLFPAVTPFELSPLVFTLNAALIGAWISFNQSLRVASIFMMGAVAVHATIWSVLTGNPYYGGQIEPFIMLIELITFALLVKPEISRWLEAQSINET